MKFLPLIWANLTRRKLRTALTVLSIAVAFLLYGFLCALKSGLSAGVTIANQDRLVVRHKVSIIQTLPVSYMDRIARIPGVKLVTHATWFGGIYQEPKNFFPQIPVEPEKYLSMYPEFVLPEDQFTAWKAKRTGAIIGRKTAEKFGFKIGDRIPIQGTIWPLASGQPSWEFDLVGIYSGTTKAADETQMFFRYDYFDEARGQGKGEIGWYMIRVTDPSRSEEVARKVDEEFSNSPWETKSEDEKAFVQSFAKQVGDIGLITTAVLSAVFFTILLICGNTMAQAVRERVGEIGVLKALGFTHQLALYLVLLESTLIAILGGALGLGTIYLVVSVLEWDPTRGALPVFFIDQHDLLIGVGLVFALGLVAGLFPAIRAMRIGVAEALRRL